MIMKGNAEKLDQIGMFLLLKWAICSGYYFPTAFFEGAQLFGPTFKDYKDGGEFLVL